MKPLIAYFGEELFDARESEEWDGICVLCGQAPYTELAHNMSNSKVNNKIFGDEMVDMPIMQVVPSCHRCNMTYARNIVHFPASLANVARRAWIRYYNSHFDGGRKCVD